MNEEAFMIGPRKNVEDRAGKMAEEISSVRRGNNPVWRALTLRALLLTC